jgi:hypothetical protein
MLDIASPAKQYRLDAHNYPSGISADFGQLNITVPDDVSVNYTATLTATAGPPPTFTTKAEPVAGSRQAGKGPHPKQCRR